MINKPKTQSFKSFFAILLLPLVGFLVFETVFFQSSFFIILALSLFLCILYMIPLRNRISAIKAATTLKRENSREHINLVEAENKQEKIAIESFQEKIINTSHLKGLTEKLSMSLTLEDTSRVLSSEVSRLFGRKDITTILYLFHSKLGELGISSSQKGEMQINLKSKKGDEYDQWLVKQMQPLLIENTKSEYRFDVEKVKTEDDRYIGSLISVPMMVGNKALGILRVDSPKQNQFSTEDLRFLTTIGDLGAVAIENAQLYERVEQLAVKDSLTDLYLRRHLQERLPEEIARHMRSKRELSFLMIDIDRFKQYNDKFGHTAGDIVLKTVGELLGGFFHLPGCLVCRYGGEEFAVLLPDCPKKKAIELSESIREFIENETVFLRRKKTNVTVSIGVATFPKDAQMKDELINKADQALYRAKENGRNQVCHF